MRGGRGGEGGVGQINQPLPWIKMREPGVCPSHPVRDHVLSCSFRIFAQTDVLCSSAVTFFTSWCPVRFSWNCFRADVLYYRTCCPSSSLYRFWSCCHDPCAFWRNWCTVLFFWNFKSELMSSPVLMKLLPSCCPILSNLLSDLMACSSCCYVWAVGCPLFHLYDIAVFIL